MNIGLFGGSFDPPHAGHLIVAQDALLALGLDRVLFVPAAHPPHKRDIRLTAAVQRARMLELALAGDPRFAMDPVELERSGPSFTVDTLAELCAREPGAEWTLLIGADQYAEFDTWREPGRIRELARLAVLTRRGEDGSRTDDSRLGGDPGSAWSVPAVRELPGGDLSVDVTRIDISATAVRHRVAAGLSIRYLVPPRVEEFICEQRLYARNGT